MAGCAAPPLDGLDQRGLLPADKRPRALEDLHLQIHGGSQDVSAQQAAALCRDDGPGNHGHRPRIFGPHIDDRFAGPDGPGADGHPFDDLVGGAFQQGAIHVGARVPLVGIADHDGPAMVLTLGQGPFPECGITGTAPATQARSLDFGDDITGRALQGRLPGRVPAAADVIKDICRVDDAAMFHDQPLLAAETGQVEDRWNAVIFFQGAQAVNQQGIAFLQIGLDQHARDAGGDFAVDDGGEGWVFDNDQGFGIAMADAADLVDAGLKISFGKHRFEGGNDLQGAGGDSAGGGSHMNHGESGRLPGMKTLVGVGAQAGKASGGYVVGG